MDFNPSHPAKLPTIILNYKLLVLHGLSFIFSISFSLTALIFPVGIINITTTYNFYKLKCPVTKYLRPRLGVGNSSRDPQVVALTCLMLFYFTSNKLRVRNLFLDSISENSVYVHLPGKGIMKYCHLPHPKFSSKLRKVKCWHVYTNIFLMGVNRIPLHFWQWVNFINGGHKLTLVTEIVEFLQQ